MLESRSSAKRRVVGGAGRAGGAVSLCRRHELITPTEMLGMMSPFSGEFIRFIGACEVLGALGLVLPWALGIRRELTPLAAAGLVIIMIGATVSTLAIGGGVLALVDVVIGVLAATAVYGRREALRVLRPTAPRPMQPRPRPGWHGEDEES